MKVRFIDSALGTRSEQQFVMSCIVNDELAIDAGSLGLVTPLEVQRNIHNVLISHSHVDHIATLPCFLENVYTADEQCPTIYGSRDVLDTLRQHMFNDRVWPDLERLASLGQDPFLKLKILESRKPVQLGRLKVTPVALDHLVPTLGFIIEEEGAAVAIISDTGPTEEIWDVVNKTANLKAVFLEASFPNSMLWLAEKAKHLTPKLFQEELKKLKHSVLIIVVHLKPAYHEQIVAELDALGLPNLEVCTADREYEF